MWNLGILTLGLSLIFWAITGLAKEAIQSIMEMKGITLGRNARTVDDPELPQTHRGRWLPLVLIQSLFGRLQAWGCWLWKQRKEYL